MVNQELVRQLLKELEAEKGCPVQLRVDTPFSEGDIIAPIDTPTKYKTEYLGSFLERRVVVKRVDDLVEKYLPDVELIEGEYESLVCLQARVKKLDILHSIPIRGTLVERTFQLVSEKTGNERLIAPLCDYVYNPSPELSAKQIYQILDEAGLTYFKEWLFVKADGVYDFVLPQRGERIKVADISLKLIE